MDDIAEEKSQVDGQDLCQPTGAIVYARKMQPSGCACSVHELNNCT